MKQLIRLTETDLHNIIKKVINEVVDESGFLQGAHKAHWIIYVRK